MEGLPILLLIIAVASVFTNYKKAAEQRMQNEKKRMEKRKNANSGLNPKQETRIQTQPAAAKVYDVKPVQKVSVQTASPAKPRVTARDMKSAVIMAEILNKPVSIREK